jgi:hypothetical protein
MAHTITANNGAGTITPVSVEGYTPSRQSRNIIHDLLDGSIGVSLITPRPRSGSLKLLFNTQADAFTALNLHGQETTFNYANTDFAAIGMKYVLDGSVDVDYNADLQVWWVTVGYQEV